MRLTIFALASLAVLLPAAASAQEGPPRAVPGVVSLHVDSPSPVRLRLHTGRIVDTHYGNVAVTQYEALESICVSPCDRTVDARGGQELSLTVIDDSFPDPPPFTLWRRSGDLTLRVIPGSKARLISGRVLTAAGAIGTIFSIGALTLATMVNSTDNTSRVTAAGAGLGVSAVALTGGIALWATSTTSLRFEPRGLGLGFSLHMGAL
jgi:hypothetical protein